MKYITLTEEEYNALEQNSEMWEKVVQRVEHDEMFSFRMDTETDSLLIYNGKDEIIQRVRKMYMKSVHEKVETLNKMYQLRNKLEKLQNRNLWQRIINKSP